jgi:pyridoxamine 5'-phosphate oxidase
MPSMTTLPDLIERLYDTISRAEAAGEPLANGMALATSSVEGRPSCRIVLLKGADEHGFVFYTNMDSPKARDLEENPRACLNFWWGGLQEQIRIDGVVERVSDEEADEYFSTRPRGSQLGAWASPQSAPLESRETLEADARRIAERHPDGSVPRPPNWSGFRLVPESMEFWFGREDRLHDRFLYTRESDAWIDQRLYP